MKWPGFRLAESPAQVVLVLQVLQVPLLGRIRCHWVHLALKHRLLVCAYFLLHRAWCHPEGGIVVLSNDNRPWLLAELWQCGMRWVGCGLRALRCALCERTKEQKK